MKFTNILVLGTLLVLLAGCNKGAEKGGFEYDINETLIPSQSELPGLNGGPARPVGVFIGPDGERVEFVVNEVVFRPESGEALDAFLAAYNGVVLRDGTPFILPDTEASQVESSGWYLIQVNVEKSSLDDLKANMEAAGVRGSHAFSSEDAVRLAALVAREAARGVGPNLVLEPVAVNEHPDNNGGYLDAETWWWMTEDDDPNTLGDQGLSVGVVRAWRYLSYLNVPPEGVWEPPVIAIIDGGFALDENTGMPLDDNTDYFPSKPKQFDLVDYSNSAGGTNLANCGGSPCPWHGTGAFGVALARHGNQYGGAGISGNIAHPLLIRVDTSAYTMADAIRSAAINGADVISISMGGFGCGSWKAFCELVPDDIYSLLQNAVLLANSYGAVVLASAGNAGIDLDTKHYIPCELSGVICVGSVNQNKNNVFNFGSNVDIWAPTGVFSTVAPHTAAADSNDTGTDELYRFGGTSASTPFVAGIVALMKALEPSLSWSQVQTILQETANDSPDPKVTKGYVDAYRAVQQVRSNPVPMITITYPEDGATIPYNPLGFRAEASDPDTDDPEAGEVAWRSDRDGLLCVVDGFYYAGIALSGCDWPDLSLGTHVITAIATDDHGATASDAVTVSVVNHPPSVEITEPEDGATYFRQQTIDFHAYISDPDGPRPFPGERVVWTSDLEGYLGDGWDLSLKLSPGLHTITATAVDELGLSGEDSITLNILVGEGLPTVDILNPTETWFSPGTEITFEAEASDPEDGALTGTSLEWFSDVDGLLGTGNRIEVVLSGGEEPCTYVFHTVIVQATDSDGHQMTADIAIRMGEICID